jgi:hypothetical protein
MATLLLPEIKKADMEMPASSFASQAGSAVAYSQQGIVTSSQQSSSQQGAAARAAVEAKAKARMARSFLMGIFGGWLGEQEDGCS